MILSPEQLAELTARKRQNGQIRALKAMGIPYRQRHDGSIVVLRSAVETIGGSSKPKREPELNLSR